MSFYNPRADGKPRTNFSEGLPDFSDTRAKLSYEKPIFSDRFKNFSPSAKKSGEEILKDLKNQLRREGDMFFNHSPPDWGFSPKASLFTKAEDGEDLGRRGGMDDIRGRHPMFRMPAWMSEDDDMSDLAARMSHTPHFATMGRRGGPWRERRSSGGSAMSATSDESCDAPTTDKSSQCSGGSNDMTAHEIPIRIEAPCPPSMAQQQQIPQQQQGMQQPQADAENDPISPLMSDLNQRKGSQVPVRTTSAVDATQPKEDIHRSARCSSAPPEMADQSLPHEVQRPNQQQRFVSKINITPQSPQSPPCSKSTAIPFSPLPAKFNTVPKPFVSSNKQPESQAAPYTFEQPNVPELQNQQPNSQQHQTQLPQSQYPPQQQPQYSQQHQYPQPQQQYQQQQQYPQPQQQYSQQQQQQQQYPQQQQYNQQQQQYPNQQQQQQYPYQQQQQQHQSPRQGQRPSVVRNIPIFVEGRDAPDGNEEPNTPPKNTQQWGQPWQQQQNTQQQNYPQQPQQQNYPQQPQQQNYPQQPQHQQHIPQQQHQQKPQYRQHTQPQPKQQKQASQPTQPIPTPIPAPAPPQPQQQQPQPQPKPPQDPRLSQIETVQASVTEYAAKVETFTGTKKDKEFLYLDEMLTRALLQLDNVDPDGRDDVRQARRAVIRNINAAISLLETKASDSTPKVDEKTTPENADMSMETDNKDQSTDTKDNEDSSIKSSDDKESAVTLPNDNSKHNEISKEEKMDTATNVEGSATPAT